MAVKILLVQPGASWATADVHTGLHGGLLELGHTVVDYALDRRIAASGAWLTHQWRKAKRLGTPLAETKPSPADVQYHAGQGIIERALRFQVDWVVVVSAMYVHPDIIWMLKEARKRVALVFTESPYDDGQQKTIAPLADVCFTNERTSVEYLRAANPNTHYLPAAYDPAVHCPMTGAVLAKEVEEVPQHDVLFVGTGFQERIDFLGAVDWGGIGLALYGEWSLLARHHPLRQYVRGGLIDNADAVRLYRRAKINLNLYRESMGFGEDAPRVHGAESLNPRAYELAACGAFQLSQERAEVDEIFKGDVVTFHDAEDCQMLIRGFLAGDDRMTHMYGSDSRQRIVEETWHKRAQQLCKALDGTMRGSVYASLGDAAG